MMGLSATLERLHPRERVLLWVCVFVLLLAIGNRLVVYHVRTRLADLSVEVKTSKTRLACNQRILAQDAGVQEQFDKIKSYVPAVASNSDATAVMFTEIEELAKRCGVNLLDRKAQGSEKLAFFEQHAIRVEVDTDRDGLMRLLYQLENSPQLLRVSKLELSKSTKGTQAPLRGVLVINKIVPSS